MYFTKLSNHNFFVSNPLDLFWLFNPLWIVPFHTPFHFLILLFSFKKNFFLFHAFKNSSLAPKRKFARSATKSKKGESSKTPGFETLNLSIPSPLTTVEVPKSWFENHMAFGKCIDVFKHRSISFVDILDYNFVLFEDFAIICAFIESTPGKLLDSGFVSYPTLVKVFYCNLSFITLNGFFAFWSYVKGQEIVITKTLINELFKISNVVDDSTPNSIAFENAKDMFVLSSHLDFSPTR